MAERTDASLLFIVGCNIKKYREKKLRDGDRSFTQQGCADKLNIAQQQWNRWESGKKLPSTANQRKIADLLDVAPSMLWEGNEKTPGTKAPGAEPPTVAGVLDACLSLQSALSDFVVKVNRERDLEPFREEIKDLAGSARSLQELLSKF